MSGTNYWMVLAEGDAKTDQITFIDELANKGLKETLMKFNPQAFLFGQ